MKNKIVNFIIENPLKAFIFSWLFIATSLPGYFYAASDYSYKVWYADDNPNLAEFKEFESKFGSDDNILISLHSKKGIFNKETLQQVKALSEKLWQVQDIIRVDSILDYPHVQSFENDIRIEPFIDADSLEDLVPQKLESIKEIAINDPNIKNWFISQDASLTVITATMRPGFDNPPPYAKIDKEIESLLKTFESDDIKLYRGGAVTMTRYNQEGTENDTKFILPMIMLIFVGIIFYLYRSLYCVLMTFGLLLLSDVMMIGFSFLLGFKVNTLAAAAPTVLLTVAMADAVHILTSFFIGLEKFDNSKKAIKYSLQKNFYPTLLTSITTSLGFLSFGIAEIIPISWMGIGISIGVICAWVLSYFCFAPMIVFRVKDLKKISRKKKKSFDLTWLASFVMKHAKSIVMISCVLMMTGVYLGSKLEVNLEPKKQFKDNHYIIQSGKFLETKLGALGSFEIMIKAQEEDGVKDPAFLRRVDSFQNWLESIEGVYQSTSIINILKKTHRSLNGDNDEFYKIPETKSAIAEELLLYQLSVPEGKDTTNLVSIKNDSMRINGRWKIDSSVEGLEIIKTIEDKLAEMKLNGLVTGKAPLTFGLVIEIVNTLGTSFFMALFFIGIVLVLVLKSVKLGLLALIPNVFPIALGAGCFYLIGAHIDLGMVLVGSVCLGIAVDDSIHFMFEYKRKKLEGATRKENFENLFAFTLPPLFFTTLILCLGFSSFVFASYIPNLKFGLMTALVLSFALIADVTLLPAVLYLTEKDPVAPAVSLDNETVELEDESSIEVPDYVPPYRPPVDQPQPDISL